MNRRRPRPLSRTMDASCRRPSPGNPPDIGSHYGEVMEKLNAAQGKWAVMIHLLTAAAVWPSWRSVLWVVGTTAFLVPLNIWITGAMMRRRGPVVSEVFRTSANISTSIILFHMTGWPLPGWLWLPFIALAYGSTRRLTAIMLTVFWGVMTAVALHDGVALIYPLTFGGLAYLCRVFTEARVGVMHDMFARSEAQRCELDTAHESLQAAVEARQSVELELRQAQKLEAIGRLASGVAHEINTPLQYLATSIPLVGEGVHDLLRLIAQWRSRLTAPAAHIDPALLGELEESARACGLEDLETMLVESLEMAQDGVGRVSTIVRSMKELAHPERLEKAPIDLNRAIHAMLTVAQHEYRYVADVTTALGDLPPVECHAGEITQVLLNLVVNAAHAVADVVESSGARGSIIVSTRAERGEVVISVADTGGGIPDAIRDKVFEPFFTTKAVGRGTGYGLAMARATVDQHGGSLSFASCPGRGTTFFVRLPIASATTLALQAAA